jgi:hypothetical protein
MLSQCSSGVQAYIMCQVRTRIYAVGNFIGVLSKHLFCPMYNVFKCVLQLLPVTEFLDQHVGWQRTAEF